MKYIFAFVSILWVVLPNFSQEINGEELLQKAIEYHDPNNNWPTFNSQFTVVMSTPNAPKRISEIKINLPEGYFWLKATKDTNTTTYKLEKSQCEFSFNGKSNLTEQEQESLKVSCNRAELYKNYYTYLYGLPMKLKDEGTIVHDLVERKRFKGKDYLVLKVSYEKSVGSDIWYFYFDPDNYAMEIYQFYKTDDLGKVVNESGEYILLSDIERINDIKMPKIRKWYYNKDDKYLGTDTLN